MFFSERRLNKLKNKKPFEYAKKIGVNLGNNVEVNQFVDWGSEPYLISIGDNTRLSLNVTFTNHDGSLSVLRNLYKDNTIDLIKPIKIGKNCFIGINSTVLYGVTIGDNVIIGACSLVTKDLESNAVYAGVPAKRICSIEEFYEKNKKYFVHTKQMSPDEKREYLIKLFASENK